MLSCSPRVDYLVWVDLVVDWAPRGGEQEPGAAAGDHLGGAPAAGDAGYDGENYRGPDLRA